MPQIWGQARDRLTCMQCVLYDVCIYSLAAVIDGEQRKYFALQPHGVSHVVYSFHCSLMY